MQFQELTALFGGYDTARYVHFFAMAAIVGFLVVHVALALLVPKSLRAMITGTIGEHTCANAKSFPASIRSC